MNSRQRYEAAVARKLAGKVRNNKATGKNGTTAGNTPSEESTGHLQTRHKARMGSESVNQQLLVDAVDEQQNVSGLMREKSTLSSYKVSYEGMMELAKVFNKIHDRMVKLAEKIEKHEIRLILNESAADNLLSFGGASELLWKIDKFPDKFMDASKGVNPVLYSPAFTAHGYKLALSLCPYGDGRAKGKYMSIFFVILRGQHDALQHWPFDYSLTFSLLGQSDAKEVDDLAVTFVANPVDANASFLCRPTTTRNHMLGLPQFVVHSDLWRNTFVKDDVIYIRVQVHH